MQIRPDAREVALLAHQGGWDEALFALVPLALFAGLLIAASSRASRARVEAPTPDPDPDTETHDERDAPA